MKYSFEGIGQWAATFGYGGVAEGELVKVSDNGMVGKCADGDGFCGMVISMGHDGEACAVALGGMVTAAYTGSAPALGWTGLASNGNGGVKTASGGQSYLVVDVDTDGMTVTFAL